MKTSILFFLLSFAVGSAVALAVRIARYEAPAPIVSAPVVAPHVEPSKHEHVEGAPVPAETATINSVCPICGMDVDPSLAPAIYEGKRVGFGCKACPPKFAADPAKYGPYALKNEVAP